ncbi:MAG: Nif3-like dinuclear metal center hexameric protein [Treponemataceae bacterium]
MTARDLDRYFRSFLELDNFASCDSSLNGLQADNDGCEISKVAFGVDACLETFERAAKCGAQLLFVHHGLFWGKPIAISGVHRRRIAALIRHNIALFAVHLPLDQHPQVGNNAALSELLGIEDPKPFGEYHGKKIGYKGTLRSPLTIEEAAKKIEYMGRPAPTLLPFGPKENRSCAVISGGAAYEALQALDEGIDLYVSGEANHGMYHNALEGKLNVIAGGHYSTEVWGVRRVMAKLAADTGIETEFLDAPTGL